MQLRLAENVAALAPNAVSTTYGPLDDGAAVILQAVLPEPQPDRRYKVSAHFMAETVSATTGTLDAQLEGSYDGATWWTLAGNSVQTEADNESLTVTVDFPMTLGSLLPTRYRRWKRTGQTCACVSQSRRPQLRSTQSPHPRGLETER
ncbi:MAG: hypothetical protein HC937_00625 [Aquincola sp.]|nr:hypothetical protein [Aquincola sp.]